MIWYEDKSGRIAGRMYEAGAGWGAEVGRQTKHGFVTTSGKKCRTFSEAERFLLENGCVGSAVS